MFGLSPSTTRLKSLDQIRYGMFPFPWRIVPPKVSHAFPQWFGLEFFICNPCAQLFWPCFVRGSTEDIKIEVEDAKLNSPSIVKILGQRLKKLWQQYDMTWHVDMHTMVCNRCLEDVIYIFIVIVHIHAKRFKLNWFWDNPLQYPAIKCLRIKQHGFNCIISTTLLPWLFPSLPPSHHLPAVQIIVTSFDALFQTDNNSDIESLLWETSLAHSHKVMISPHVKTCGWPLFGNWATSPESSVSLDEVSIPSRGYMIND